MASRLSNGTLSYQPVVEKTFNLAAYSGRIQPPHPGTTFNKTVPDTSLAKACGTNCTYSITFQAPAIKCADNLPYKWNTTNMPWSGPKQLMGESVFLTRKEKHEHLLWVGYIPEIDLLGKDQEPIVPKFSCPLLRNIQFAVLPLPCTNHLWGRDSLPRSCTSSTTAQ